MVGDQSIFVRGAISGVVREGVIAAALTALMILMFLGSWRSALIIAVSIPLSMLASIIVLSALGQTINIMTLGGLALAVGILVDDATVTMENIDRHLAMGKDVPQAILDGAHQIAMPAFVSTLCICIVFVPMFFLTGVAKYLFVPLAEAVVFAMLASYFLSRTLVPTMAKYLLHAHETLEDVEHGDGHHRNALLRAQIALEHGFERMRDAYKGVLAGLLRIARVLSPCCFLLSRSVRRSCSACGWVQISFRRSIPGRSSSICAPTPARASRKPRALCDQVDARSGARFRRTNSTASSTISASPTAASICPTATRSRSARPMPIS